MKSSPDVATENSKEKKKKEKPVIMSLDEFVRSGGESVATSNTEGIYGSTKEQPVSALDEFMDWPDESLTVKGNSLDDCKYICWLVILFVILSILTVIRHSSF